MDDAQDDIVLARDKEAQSQQLRAQELYNKDDPKVQQNLEAAARELDQEARNLRAEADQLVAEENNSAAEEEEAA